METALSPLEFARRARRLYPGREAVVDGEQRLTYGQFFARGDSWASALQDLGVTQGDRVAYIAPRIRTTTSSRSMPSPRGFRLPLRPSSSDVTFAWTGRVVRLDPGTTKNREGRSFPFTVALETLLKEQHATHERLKKAGRLVPCVFHRDGEPIRTFRGAWRTARTAAGVPGRVLPDFRRTAVRNLKRAGVPRSAAMAMVGHKTEAIYRRYAIVDAGVLREAAEKIDRAVKSATGTSTGTTTTTEQQPAKAQSA